MRFLASEAAAALHGTLQGPDVMLDGADFDSRTVDPGQLFVPIVAERDGHDFIPDALARGAAAYLTERPTVGGTAIEVDDTAAALVTLATWARSRTVARVVGITGSVGKTSTKDLAAAAMGGSLRTWANRRSFNNEQGLPVTILGAPDDTEVLVVEMGMRGFGEITRLCAIAQPHIGVVTAVSEAHSERVGGVAGVQRAKAELVQALPVRGVAVLNADDERVAAMASMTQAEVVTFGESPTAHVRFSAVRLDEMGRPSCRFETPWGPAEVSLTMPGRHMLTNAAAAITVAGLVGVPVERAAKALATASLSPMRMELVRSATGVLVLNDSYNANPTSMASALQALAALPGRRHVAVVGVMAELDEAARHHLSIVSQAHELGIELRAVGTDLYGVAPMTIDEAAVGLGDGDAVLVKGSRVAGLEHFVALLLARP